MYKRGKLAVLAISVVVASFVLVSLTVIFYQSEKNACNVMKENIDFVDTQYSCYDSIKDQSSFSIVTGDVDEIRLVIGSSYSPKSISLIAGQGDSLIRPIVGSYGDAISFDKDKTNTFVYKGSEKEVSIVSVTKKNVCTVDKTIELKPCTQNVSDEIDSGNDVDKNIPTYGGGGGGGGGSSSSSGGGNSQPQCSDGIDNDGNGVADWPADTGCTDANDNSEFGGGTSSLGSCEDGIDNDHDSWIDSEDIDCTQASDEENWIALTTCSDGIDNDRNGLTDKEDPSCSSAYDEERPVGTIGFRSDTLSECSDGVDNDNDGVFDYPNDPGCSDVFDNDESDEIHFSNFNFTFGPDGYVQEINWTNSSGKVNRVVWDEKNGRYGGGGVRFYPHSSVGDFAGLSFRYYLNGNYISRTHNAINYNKTFTSSDIVRIKANDSYLEVNTSYRFYNNTIYETINVRNKANYQMTKVIVPSYLGGIIVGNYNQSYNINITNTGITRLIPWFGGTLENNFTSLGGQKYNYPHIRSFSPVSMMQDGNIAVGQQLVSEITMPDFVEIWHKAYLQFTPSFNMNINLDKLEPYESRTFVIATKVSDNGWQDSLEPYEKWFNSRYNGNEPSYCPAGVFSDLVGSNANSLGVWDAYNYTTNRYRAGINISEIFKPNKTASVMQSLGFEYFGIWQTALNSACLIGDKNCSRTFVQECYDAGNVGSSANCEFNSNIDLIDPNIDAGRNKTKIKDFTQQYMPYNISVFWYIRPCAEIYGANISFDSQGNEVFTAGKPSGYADVDLRNVTNRDKHFNRVYELAQQGVRGFYYDATSCPGDEAFFAYVKRNLTETFGSNFFFFEEGARDREALRMPQLPLIKDPYYSYNSSALLTFLVPDATYYGGVINEPLNFTNGEMQDVLNKGYTAVPLNYPPEFYQLDSIQEGMKIGVRACNLINQSYYNRLEKWQSYGSDIGCPMPIAPPNCPVS